MKVIYPNIHNFIYPCLIESSKDIYEYSENLFGIIEASATRAYTEYQYQIISSNEFFDSTMKTNLNTKKLSKQIHQVIENLHHTSGFHIVSEDKKHSLLFRVSYLADDLYMILIIIYDEKVARIYPFVIQVNNGLEYINPDTMAPLYYSKKNNNAISAAKAELGIMYAMDDKSNIMYYLSECLTLYSNKENHRKSYYPSTWGTMEMEVFKAFIRSRKSIDGNFFLLALHAGNDDIACIEKFRAFKPLTKKYLNPKRNLDEIPLIDLTDKEWSFILKYVSKITEPINLNTYINNCIGNDMVIEISFRYKKEDEPITRPIYIHIETNSVDDIMRVYLVDIINKKISYGITADFININDFNENSILNIVKYVNYLDENDMHSSSEQLVARSPMISMNQDDVIHTILKIVHLMIVAHDRPSRNRIVRKRELKSTARDKHKKNYSEKDYTIKRILKPINEVKSLIKQSQEKSGSTHRYAEYTMEEWERREHTRVMKSGKIVTVAATHCKRHLPLSEKEIHIKL